MGKGIGDHVALGLLLKPVVANGIRCVQCLFNVPGFKDIFHFLRMVRPNAGKKVGLQFKPDRQLIVFRFSQTASLRLHLPADTQYVLYVMAHLMRDHISHRKVTRGAKAFPQLIVE